MSRNQVDVYDLLSQIGLTKDEVGRALPEDEWEMEDLDLGEEVGAAIKRSMGHLNITDINNISKIVNTKSEGVERYYAAAATISAARLNMQPNASVGLYGDNAAAGFTYPANTAVVLRPRLANAIQTKDFTFTKRMTFHSIMTGLADCANGWRFVGGTTMLSDTIVSSMKFDTPFDAFRPELGPERTPMAVFSGRSPGDNVTFGCSAMHSNAAATVLQAGVLLNYFDTSCRDDTDKMENALADLDFAGIANELRAANAAQKKKARGKVVIARRR